MRLSKRLKKIEELVKDNSSILDVGCDHGLLDIYLYQTKSNINIIASDIKSGPLEKAFQNFKKYDLDNKITLKKGDGLQWLNNTIDTVIIAGLGGITISKIISKDNNKISNIHNFILAPNSDYELVRKTMTKLNYGLKEEYLICENNHYYFIMNFQSNYKLLDKKHIKYGLYENNNEYSIYYQKLIEKYKKIILLLPSSKIIKKIVLKTKIKRLRNINNY